MEKSTKLSVCDTCRTTPKTGKTERTDLGIFADQEGFLNGLKGNMHFNMGYPHYPQVYPQSKKGKPLENTGLSRGFDKFIHSSTETC